jgi:hypothetical protein
MDNNHRQFRRWRNTTAPWRRGITSGQDHVATLRVMRGDVLKHTVDVAEAKAILQTMQDSMQRLAETTTAEELRGEFINHLNLSTVFDS